jgi:hypothetical protein
MHRRALIDGAYREEARPSRGEERMREFLLAAAVSAIIIGVMLGIG